MIRLPSQLIAAGPHRVADAAPLIALTIGNTYILSLLRGRQRVLDAPFPPMANGDDK
ncbi:hypothetical protein GS872_00865 [Rhodococcus hoagii]|nr:hypothetical protein [Prescottella equi]